MNIIITLVSYNSVSENLSRTRALQWETSENETNEVRNKIKRDQYGQLGINWEMSSARVGVLSSLNGECLVHLK